MQPIGPEPRNEESSTLELPLRHERCSQKLFGPTDLSTIPSTDTQPSVSPAQETGSLVENPDDVPYRAPDTMQVTGVDSNGTCWTDWAYERRTVSKRFNLDFLLRKSDLEKESSVSGPENSKTKASKDGGDKTVLKLGAAALLERRGRKKEPGKVGDVLYH